MTDGVRAQLIASIQGASSPLAAANQLCVACVDVLGIDGASISLVHEGSTRGTFGSSDALSREVDDLQFTFGEGPCLEAVRDGQVVLVPDLDDVDESRWAAFRDAALTKGVHAVFALPISMSTEQVGALDLYRRAHGPLTDDELTGSLYAAELATLPLLNLLASVDWTEVADGSNAWTELASLERVEVYQATGIIIGALDVGPADALVRLRAYAYANSMTASEVAWDLVEGRLVPDADEWQRTGGER